MVGQVHVSIDPKMTRLVTAMSAALRHADLDDSLAEVSERLIKSRRLVEVRPSPTGLIAQLSPYAELVILTALAEARSTTHPTVRARRITSALNIGGF